MRLYNPTPEAIGGSFDGRRYPILPNSFIEVADMIGSWILERESFRGLVELNTSSVKPGDKNGKKNFERYIVEQTFKGLELYIEMKNEVLNQWINLDTELKGENQYGTTLQHKDVRACTKAIETAKSLIKDLESKYNLKFEKEEILQKSVDMQHSIDTIISEFEADAEKKALSVKQEKELNDLLSSMIPKNEITGNTSISI